jgi:hypothetical protein
VSWLEEQENVTARSLRTRLKFLRRRMLWVAESEHTEKLHRHNVRRSQSGVVRLHPSPSQPAETETSGDIHEPKEGKASSRKKAKTGAYFLLCLIKTFTDIGECALLCWCVEYAYVVH